MTAQCICLLCARKLAGRQMLAPLWRLRNASACALAGSLVGRCLLRYGDCAMHLPVRSQARWSADACSVMATAQCICLCARRLAGRQMLAPLWRLRNASTCASFMLGGLSTGDVFWSLSRNVGACGAGEIYTEINASRRPILLYGPGSALASLEARCGVPVSFLRRSGHPTGCLPRRDRLSN